MCHTFKFCIFNIPNWALIHKTHLQVTIDTEEDFSSSPFQLQQGPVEPSSGHLFGLMCTPQEKIGSSFAVKIYVLFFFFFPCALPFPPHTLYSMSILLSLGSSCHPPHPNMFYRPLKREAALLFWYQIINLFIFLPGLWAPVNDWLPPACSEMISRGIRYITSICFPPLSGMDDIADKHSFSGGGSPRLYNKCVLCSTILIVSSTWCR